MRCHARSSVVVGWALIPEGLVGGWAGALLGQCWYASACNRLGKLFGEGHASDCHGLCSWRRPPAADQESEGRAPGLPRVAHLNLVHAGRVACNVAWQCRCRRMGIPSLQPRSRREGQMVDQHRHEQGDSLRHDFGQTRRLHHVQPHGHCAESVDPWGGAGLSG